MVTIAFAAAAPHVGLPDVGPPGTPGPFAFADPNRLTCALHAGGFGDVTVEKITRSARFGNDIDDVVDYITSLPESRQLFAGQPDEKIAAAIDALREGFASLRWTRRRRGRRVGLVGASVALELSDGRVGVRHLSD